MTQSSDKSGVIRLGVVGSAGRGSSFRRSIELIDGLEVEAVCDTNLAKLEESRQAMGAKVAYSDYQKMLDESAVNAVIIGTPMPYHASQAIAALQSGRHVLSEVTAAVSMEEARALVKAAKASSGVYMMAENYIFNRPAMMVTEMVRRGLFGTPYYAEGEYLHELKELNEKTPWRRKWQTGINGVTYGTHSLGPILQWMAGDRVVKVSCAGSGQRYIDPRGDAYENEASCVMLCKTARDALIKIRVDMLSDRPHAMRNLQLQGTQGCYESGRGIGKDSVWLKSFPKETKWKSLEEMGDEFIPEAWKKDFANAAQAGHGGGDYFELVAFRDAIAGLRENPIDIHAAMDMTLPGIISQQSIAQGGAWLEVPDSREWS